MPLHWLCIHMVIRLFSYVRLWVTHVALLFNVTMCIHTYFFLMHAPQNAQLFIFWNLNFEIHLFSFQFAALIARVVYISPPRFSCLTKHFVWCLYFSSFQFSAQLWQVQHADIAHRSSAHIRHFNRGPNVPRHFPSTLATCLVHGTAQIHNYFNPNHGTTQICDILHWFDFLDLFRYRIIPETLRATSSSFDNNSIKRLWQYPNQLFSLTRIMVLPKFSIFHAFFPHTHTHLDTRMHARTLNDLWGRGVVFAHGLSFPAIEWLAQLNQRDKQSTKTHQLLRSTYLKKHFEFAITTTEKIYLVSRRMRMF